jgi:hypothetical protein
MGEHLMSCGNKTDQCPKCRQYVRRAIFVYHYENNCANPDALQKNEETNPKNATNQQRQPENKNSTRGSGTQIILK